MFKPTRALLVTPQELGTAALASTEPLPDDEDEYEIEAEDEDDEEDVEDDDYEEEDDEDEEAPGGRARPPPVLLSPALTSHNTHLIWLCCDGLSMMSAC